jgi:hypothetical protein
MPADGTIVAAHCHERRYRHIPFSGSWRTNKPGSSYVVLYQELNAKGRAVNWRHSRQRRNKSTPRPSGTRICAANREFYAFFIMQKYYGLEG